MSFIVPPLRRLLPVSQLQPSHSACDFTLLKRDDKGVSMTHLHKPNYWWTFFYFDIFSLRSTSTAIFQIPAFVQLSGEETSKSNWFKSSSRVIYISIKISSRCFFTFLALSLCVSVGRCPLTAIDIIDVLWISNWFKITRARDELFMCNLEMFNASTARKLTARRLHWLSRASSDCRRTPFSLSLSLLITQS